MIAPVLHSEGRNFARKGQLVSCRFLEYKSYLRNFGRSVQLQTKNNNYQCGLLPVLKTPS